MANEYLKRTPTSTGNRKVWTWSGWVKINKDFGSSDYNTVWSVAAGVSGDNSDRFHLYHYADGRWGTTGTSSFSQIFTGPGGSAAHSRDPGSWIHICLSVDTTTSSLTPDKIQRFWINGIEYNYDDAGNIAANANLAINGPYEHYIGNRDSNVTRTFDGQMTDIFLVDGQALTPDVFGFYKEGKGYISAGSTQSTDFRPGQWVPKAPRTIKSEINRRGGFGVNGFYLPMNDSSNFGADFHTTPNSIITLKGEDLPQPRNGAPTTSDAYVSQLRSDPYATNLVLAVPGISTSTSANLITNGTFDSGTSNWTAQTNATLTNPDGALRITATATAGASQGSIPVVSGERYTLSFRARTDGTNFANFSLDLGGTIQYVGNITSTDWINITKSFTSNTTGNATLTPYKAISGWAEFDDIVFKQEDAPRDYSADIKGSGTNKTLTANGNAGVGYEIPSYYGSALSFDGSGDYFRTTSNISDFQFGTDDFTIESWIWKSANGSQNYDGLIALGTNGSATDGWFFEISATRGYFFAANGQWVSYNVNPNTSQWNHVVAERYNGITTIYLNGVAIVSGTNIGSIPTNGTSVDIGGYSLDGTGGDYYFNGYIQDLRVYKGVAKYKGGFDVPKPYTPVGIATWRAVPDCTANNFATWNPLYPGWTGSAVENAEFTNGNLTVSESSATISQGTATIGVSTGKWYYEAIPIITSANSNLIGIRPAEWFTFNQQNRTSWRNGGAVYNDAGNTSQSGTTYTSNDIIGVAIDMNNRRLWFSKNGSWVYSGDPNNNLNPAVSFASTYTHYTPFFAFDNVAGTESWTANFGQNPTFSGNTTAGTYTDSNGKGLFKYQPPSGFLALCEDNLPTPAIADPGKHFKTVLWTGDGNSGRSITGVGFKPDFVWIKKRAGATENHNLFDSIRGANTYLQSNTAGAEGVAGIPMLTSFDDGGFSLGSNGGVNESTHTFAAWCWKAGGAAVTNTDGSITSQVSVNQDAGFSIVSYTGTGANATVGHGLGKAPSFMVIKNRTAAEGWINYHSSVGPTQFLQFNSTNAAVTNSSVFNNTSPTSSVFSVGTIANTNGSAANLIAYCWAEIEGFSKAFSYVGNGSADGPFVFLNMKPALIVVKRTDNTGNWQIYDSSRMSTNPNTGVLFPNLSNVEGVGSGYDIDFLSNGFKLRSTDTDRNASGSTYVGFAWAESPFQTANSK